MITYLKGDATQPVGEGCKTIIHICNDIGMWGAGFTKSLSKQFPQAEELYKQRYSENDIKRKCLGAIQFVNISDEIKIINMIAQKGVRTSWNPIPIDYVALKECLIKVSMIQAYPEYYPIGDSDIEYSVHMPRIGCGLAGGSWDIIEPMIQKSFVLNDIPVFVYDL
jgi:hypothetical protein